MKINFLKILFLLLIFLFFFGDFFLLKKNLLKWLITLNNVIKFVINNFITKTRKKGVEPLTFGFGNQRYTKLNYSLNIL